MYRIIGGDGKPYGPVSAEQIKQWYQEGRINGLTKVCAEGGADWKALMAWPELQVLVATPPLLGAQPATFGGPGPSPFPGYTTKPPPNYLVHAILCTICCCPLFGPVAIFYAIRVNNKMAQGDYEGALKASASARLWFWVGVVVGLLGTLAQLAYIGPILKTLQQGMNLQ